MHSSLAIIQKHLRNMRKSFINAHFRFIRIIYEYFLLKDKQMKLCNYFKIQQKVEETLPGRYFNTLTVI